MRKSALLAAAATLVLSGCGGSSSEGEAHPSESGASEQAAASSEVSSKAILASLMPGEYRAKDESDDASCEAADGFKTACLPREKWKAVCENLSGAYNSALTQKVRQSVGGASFDEIMAFLNSASVGIKYNWDESFPYYKACRYHVTINGLLNGSTVNVDQTGEVVFVVIEESKEIVGKTLI